MKFKASVDYGMRTVIYLALKDDVCSSREISEEMSIPRDYLIQLALHLRDAGLVKTRAGKNGGYELAKSPEDITLGQIIDIFDNDLKHPCKSLQLQQDAPTSTKDVCNLHDLILESFNGYLNAITLQALLNIMQSGSTREFLARELEEEAVRLRA